jgi:hypothetical protein
MTQSQTGKENAFIFKTKNEFEDVSDHVSQDKRKRASPFSGMRAGFFIRQKTIFPVQNKGRLLFRDRTTGA